METIFNWITAHASSAHWIIFGCILLAGFNLPFSLDILTIVAAIIAATLLPENTLWLFLSIFMGAYLSAWIAYGIGSLLGDKLSKIRWFAKALPPHRLTKIKVFYEKHAFLTLLVGRFIPFGFRNCLFMTAGISKMHFKKFILRDLLASFLWSSAAFFTFYILGQNYQTIYKNLRIFNIILFSATVAFVSVIFWLKQKRRKNLPTLVE